MALDAARDIQPWSTRKVARGVIQMVREVRGWPGRRWLVAALVAIGVAVVTTVPTDVLPNPWFTRAMGVAWWSYPVLLVTSALSGLLAATYVALRPAMEAEAGSRPARLGSVGGLATFFAVGCPMCNKLVVMAVGVGGSMTWFAPLQPVLAAVSVGLLIVAVRIRLGAMVACPVAPAPADAVTLATTTDN